MEAVAEDTQPVVEETPETAAPETPAAEETKADEAEPAATE